MKTAKMIFLEAMKQGFVRYATNVLTLICSSLTTYTGQMHFIALGEATSHTLLELMITYHNSIR